MAEHAKGCRAAIAVFGLLFLVVGVYAVMGDLGSATKMVDKWSLVILLGGLMLLLKGAVGGKGCPGCSGKY